MSTSSPKKNDKDISTIAPSKKTAGSSSDLSHPPLLSTEKMKQELTKEQKAELTHHLAVNNIAVDIAEQKNITKGTEESSHISLDIDEDLMLVLYKDFISQEITHPADVAEHLENLSLKEQVYLIEKLPVEMAAETLAELGEHTRVDILEHIDAERAAHLVGEMSPDDAADILDELEEEHSDSLLSKLESEDAEEIRTLMAFDPETAGGIMNTEILILEEHLTADEAIQQLRKEISDKEIPYYAYIVTEGDNLKGVLSLRDLLLCRPGKTLSEALKNQELITATYDASREEVARTIRHYNFMALPVVDYEGRLLGVISNDDIIDMIDALAGEDMLGMVGAGQDESIETPWLESVKMRLPWLLVNMINSVLSASVVYFFEGTIAEMAILAVFMPMVANQAGNTGQQALAILIRELAMGKIEGKKVQKAVVREAQIGFVNGSILSILVWVGVYIFTHNSALSFVMIGALLLDMLLGALAGASIPLILKKFGRDPAQASSIFLTAITDGAGFFLFLGLATIFLL